VATVIRLEDKPSETYVLRPRGLDRGRTYAATPSSDSLHPRGQRRSRTDRHRAVPESELLLFNESQDIWLRGNEAARRCSKRSGEWRQSRSWRSGGTRRTGCVPDRPRGRRRAEASLGGMS